MLICVCLRIPASSRIPRYDLGRQTPPFLRWFCHSGELQQQVSDPTLQVLAVGVVRLRWSSVCCRRFVDGELLVDPAKEGLWHLLHRVKAQPDPLPMLATMTSRGTNFPVEGVAVVSMCAIGVPLGAGFGVYVMVVGPFGGALASVWSGFLPLGRTVLGGFVSGLCFMHCGCDRCNNSLLS
jgi:hypothetical protein